MRIVKNVRYGDGPHDRLTQMAGAVGAAFEGHVDNQPGDRIIVIVEDDNDVGTMIFGYDSTAEVAVTLMGVFQAMADVVIQGDDEG